MVFLMQQTASDSYISGLDSEVKPRCCFFLRLTLLVYLKPDVFGWTNCIFLPTNGKYISYIRPAIADFIVQTWAQLWLTVIRYRPETFVRYDLNTIDNVCSCACVLLLGTSLSIFGMRITWPRGFHISFSYSNFVVDSIKFLLLGGIRRWELPCQWSIIVSPWPNMKLSGIVVAKLIWIQFLCSLFLWSFVSEIFRLLPSSVLFLWLSCTSNWIVSHITSLWHYLSCRGTDTWFS